MLRFFIGLLLGVFLTVEALGFAGVGHGTYAPLVFTASVAAFIPLLGLFAGPLLWAFYFLLIPNLERSWSQITAVSLVLLAHFGSGFWLAYEDPAFTRGRLGGTIGVWNHGSGNNRLFTFVLCSKPEGQCPPQKLLTRFSRGC